MTGRVLRTLVLVTIGQSLAPFAWGQPSRSAAHVLPEIIAKAAVIAPPDGGGTSHTQHFVNGLPLTSVPSALNAALALQMADLPGAPTAGGVLFSGRRSGSGLENAFGTSYSARGHTLGKGRFAGAITFQDTNLETLDGVNLRSGGINFLFAHEQCCGDTNDVLQETVYLRLNRKVTSFVLAYGVNDRVDIGVAVPVVQVTMGARVASRILRVGTSFNPATHSFDPLFRATRTTYLDVNYERGGAGANYGTDAEHARGFGDIRVQSKFRIAGAENTGLALTAELSMPTGRTEDFLGTGAWRVIPGVAWSGVAGRAAPHMTLSYAYASGTLSSQLDTSQRIDLTVPSALNWTAGLDFALAPRVTVMFDTIGRRVDDVQRFATGTTVFARGIPGGPPPDVAAGTDLILDGRGTLNQAFGTIGSRFNLGGDVFATATVFFPILKNGLTPRPAAVFGLDYDF